MDDEQISRLVNQFVRTFRKFGGAKQDFSQDFVIGFRENKHKGYQELVAAARENANEFDTIFEFPKLEGDELNQTIQLAGYLSLKLRDYELSRKKAKGGRTTASRMTPEQRSASAKKAATMSGWPIAGLPSSTDAASSPRTVSARNGRARSSTDCCSAISSGTAVRS